MYLTLPDNGNNMIFLYNHSLKTIIFQTNIFPYMYYLWHPLTYLHVFAQTLNGTEPCGYFNF